MRWGFEIGAFPKVIYPKNSRIKRILRLFWGANAAVKAIFKIPAILVLYFLKYFFPIFMKKIELFMHCSVRIRMLINI